MDYLFKEEDILVSDRQGETVKKGISIVIPAYNEEGGIAPVLQAVDEVLAATTLSYEIIVVNDGSQDNTRGAIQHSGVDLIVVNHDVNRGYGASLKTGIRRAQYATIVITDADGTYPNGRIPELVRLSEEGYDMVVGARVGQDVHIPALRRPPKWVLRKLANYLTDMEIPDLNSGLRVMRREVVERFMNILPNGFSFTTTITLSLLTNGYNVKYIPIDYHRRTGQSKIRPIRDTLNFLQLILRTVLYFEPLKIFIPASLLVLGVGLALFSCGWFLFGVVLDISFIVLVTCAIQLVAIGLLADLFDKRL
jgi:glycosyltransferase involved in cell wall biosynthesis